MSNVAPNNQARKWLNECRVRLAPADYEALVEWLKKHDPNVLT